VAALLGKSALEGAYFNVLINLPSLKDENFKSQISSQANEIMAKTTELSDSILKTVREKLGCPTAS
jgi:formiminotetrahydrofolate cyclodeaminase